MNARIRRHPIGITVVLVLFLAVVAIGGYGIWLAGSVDALPWQTVPTPYAGAPFAGIPGFGGGVATPTGTVAP
jgi:hypothetical protein